MMYASIPPEVLLLCGYLHQELSTRKFKGNLFTRCNKKSIYRHNNQAMVAASGEINMVVEVIDLEKAQKIIKEK